MSRARSRSLVFRAVRRLVRWYERAQSADTKRNLRSCGENVRIGQQVIIWGEDCVSLGDNVEINSFTHIFGAGGVTIGDGTLISACCSIASVTHATDDAERFRNPIIRSAVSIGRNVWVGTGAIILPGIAIGDHAVIGAGAVVTRDVPNGAVAIGCPARVVRQVVLDQRSGSGHRT